MLLYVRRPEQKGNTYAESAALSAKDLGALAL